MAAYQDSGLGGGASGGRKETELEPLMKDEGAGVEGDGACDSDSNFEGNPSVVESPPQLATGRSSSSTFLLLMLLSIMGACTLFFTVFGTAEETLIASKAVQKGLRAGLPGGVAMMLQVVLFMWMRTIVNYQYRHGGGVRDTVGRLWRDGGIPRFYRGLLPAMFQAAITRFGDTAANEGVRRHPSLSLSLSLSPLFPLSAWLQHSFKCAPAIKIHDETQRTGNWWM
jgi:hypothetical protein